MKVNNKVPVKAPQITLQFSIINNKKLMSFRYIIFVYSENQPQHIITLCGHSSVILMLKRVVLNCNNGCASQVKCRSLLQWPSNFDLLKFFWFTNRLNSSGISEDWHFILHR